MITLNHRKADILNQLFNQNLTAMVGNLAQVAEELEKAQATIEAKDKEIAELKAKLPTEPVEVSTSPA